MPPEPFVSLAKAPPAKRSEISYGKENEIIGHFRVLLCLCFKTSLSAKHFI